MIVPMKRLTLIGLKAEREAALAALQRVEAVEIISQQDVAADSERLMLLEDKIAKLNIAQKAVKPYYKKPLLNPTPQVECSLLDASRKRGGELCSEIELLEQRKKELEATGERLAALEESLKPFKELPTPLENICPTKHVRYIVGVADKGAMAAIAAMEAEGEDIAVETYPCDNGTAVVMACLGSAYDTAMRTLKETGFSEFVPTKLKGTAAQNMEKARKEADEAAKELETIVKKLGEAAKEQNILQLAGDSYEVERERAAGENKLAATEYAYILEGWVRADRLDEVRLALDGVTDAYSMELRDPQDDEDPPTVTKNKKLIEPFEAITEMYALPAYRGVDAAAVMAPFYFLFFGMMLSDTGYGLILFIGGLLFTKLLKPRGSTAKLVNVITYGGLSTILCGPFIGTFFGMSWNDIFGTTIFPLLFDPMTDVMEMMILSCGLGLLHMYSGICVKMYMCFKQKDWQSAIFDQLSWMLLLTGLIMLFAFPAIKTVSLVLVILGGGMLLLFAGRSKKNPILRLGGGLSALYNITGYLSDILSYVRIFALGLVSGAMGMVFNLIGGMVYDAFGGLGIVGVIIGVLFAAVLLLALHLFSLFINTLGAFAHTARLQFIEFFGKFYEADGHAFKPLGYNTKNVNVVGKGNTKR